MRRWLVTPGFLGALAAAVVFAPAAQADDDVRRELDSLKGRLREQERRILELEGGAPTKDEIASAVDRYLGSAPSVIAVGGADEAKFGFPMGGAPFISQGPNKIGFKFRNQVRYEAFLYSDDAVGTLQSPPNTLSDAAPRDRSGFEIERLFFTIEGSVFCPDITYQLALNFDSDRAGDVEKEYAWLDWKYSGEHHVRAGNDKVPFTIEEQTSSGSLAFVDRSLFTKAYALDSDTGVQLWGHFGSCDCPKQWLYRLSVTTGEGPTHSAGSVFSTDAFDTYSDELLYCASLEYTFTGKDWKLDEVDSRPAKDRCKWDASLGAAVYHENDDDPSQRAYGLALRSTGRNERTGIGAWFRARWQGWSFLAEAAQRTIDYTAGNPAETQTDFGATAMVHYRFCDSNWGLGVRGSMIWLDDDYDTITVGPNTVDIEDTIPEIGFVVNYFFWDHGNKLSLDVTWVQDNTGVNSSSAGYFFDPTRGIVVEDGVMIRLQWQLGF